jgi:hypothetical protein
MDAGYNTNLSARGGIVDKPSSNHTIPILREGKKWLIDLEELMEIKVRRPVYCYMASITNQVLRLRERMGHPGAEAMCAAINSGTWQNAKLTVEQIRRAMNQNPCLPCILATRNKP